MLRLYHLLLTLIVSMGLLTACSLGAPAIKVAKMVKTPGNTEAVTHFAVDEPFYATLQLENAAEDTRVKAVWRAVETGGYYEANYSPWSETQQPLPDEDTMLFELASGSGYWPAGRYKVEFYLDDQAEPGQALEFQVEGVPPTPAPTATPQPEATPVPLPSAATSTPASLSSQLSGIARLNSDFRPAPADQAEADPFELEAYTHPSGAFSFPIPADWSLVDEDESGSIVSDGHSYLGGLFLDAGGPYDPENLQASIISRQVKFLTAQFATDVALADPDNPDNSQGTIPGQPIHYMALKYEAPGGGGDMDIFFEQQENIVFVLYFVTPDYERWASTWHTIRQRHEVDVILAVAALEDALIFDPIWLKPPPTPTPVPPTPTPARTGPTAPPGQGLIIFSNHTAYDIDLDIINESTKATVHHATIPPFSQRVFIVPPGRYTYTGRSPGGEIILVNVPIFTVAVGQVVPAGVR